MTWERLDAGHVHHAVLLAQVAIPLVGLHRARRARVGTQHPEAAELALPPEAARCGPLGNTDKRSEAAVRARRVAAYPRPAAREARRPRAGRRRGDWRRPREPLARALGASR
eukprot:7972453-Alexandrium_andersonii.AAC.1